MLNLIIVIALGSVPIISEQTRQDLEEIQKDFDRVAHCINSTDSMISRIEFMIETPIEEKIGLSSWYKDKAAGVLISPNIKKGLKMDFKSVF